MPQPTPQAALIAWPLSNTYRLRTEARATQSRKALRKLAHELVDQIPYVERQLHRKRPQVPLPDPITAKAELAGAKELSALREATMALLDALKAALAAGLKVPFLEEPRAEERPRMAR